MMRKTSVLLCLLACMPTAMVAAYSTEPQAYSSSSLLSTATSETSSSAATTTRRHKEVSLQYKRQSLCYTLWAKQHSVAVGNVCVQPDRTYADQLVVAYTASDGWKFVETQLWIGRNLTQLPTAANAEEAAAEAANQVVEDDVYGDDDALTDDIAEIVEEALEEVESLLHLQPLLLREPQEPALDQFPYVTTDLQGKHSHYGYVVKLSDLGYFACPDTSGTQFVAVAHATMQARSSLRNDNTNTLASAWAGVVVGDNDNNQQQQQQQLPQREWLAFNFTLICDLIPERAKDAPERHHANLLPI